MLKHICIHSFIWGLTGWVMRNLKTAYISFLSFPHKPCLLFSVNLHNKNSNINNGTCYLLGMCPGPDILRPHIQESWVTLLNAVNWMNYFAFILFQNDHPTVLWHLERRENKCFFSVIKLLYIPLIILKISGQIIILYLHICKSLGHSSNNNFKINYSARNHIS